MSSWKRYLLVLLTETGNRKVLKVATNEDIIAVSELSKKNATGSPPVLIHSFIPSSFFAVSIILLANRAAAAAAATCPEFHGKAFPPPPPPLPRKGIRLTNIL